MHLIATKEKLIALSQIKKSAADGPVSLERWARSWPHSIAPDRRNAPLAYLERFNEAQMQIQHDVEIIRDTAQQMDTCANEIP